MSFVQRELDRISPAIVDPENASVRDQLYAAQQALGWSLDPASAKPPYNMIMGIPSEPGDCPGEPHPLSSFPRPTFTATVTSSLSGGMSGR